MPTTNLFSENRILSVLNQFITTTCKVVSMLPIALSTRPNTLLTWRESSSPQTPSRSSTTLCCVSNQSKKIHREFRHMAPCRGALTSGWVRSNDKHRHPNYNGCNRHGEHVVVRPTKHIVAEFILFFHRLLLSKFQKISTNKALQTVYNQPSVK